MKRPVKRCAVPVLLLSLVTLAVAASALWQRLEKDGLHDPATVALRNIELADAIVAACAP